MKKYFPLILLFFNCICKAQLPYHFVYKNPSLTYLYNIPQTISTHNSGLISVDGDYQLEVLKFDSTGNNEWTKFFSIPGTPMIPGGIVELENHDFIVSGSFQLNNGINVTFYLLRIDSAGNLKSLKIAADTMQVGQDWGGAISISKSTISNDLILSGSAQETITSPRWSFVAKLDSAENILWTKLFLPDSIKFSSVTKTRNVENGNLLSAGFYTEFDSVNKTYLAVSKFDSAGDVLWFNLFLTEMEPGGSCDIAEKSDGYYILTSRPGVMHAAPDIYKILKTSGMLQWHATYSNFGLYYPSVLSTSDNRILFSATLDSTFFYSSACAELDTNGFIIDAQLYPIGQFPYRLAGIAQSKANYITLYGLGVFDNPFLGHYILSVDSLNQFPCISTSITLGPPIFRQDSIVPAGLLASDTILLQDITSLLVTGANVLTPVDACSYVGISFPEYNHFQIFPNPTTGKFEIKNDKLKIESVRVYNILGKELMTLSLHTPNSLLHTEVDITNLPAGIYIVQITSGEKIWREKIIKE